MRDSQGMADRGAGVALFDPDGRILMIKEAYGRRRWGLPGGGQQPGEDSRETAVREDKEETGLDVRLGDLVGEYRISYDDGAAPTHRVRLRRGDRRRWLRPNVST
jgi:8-oxo-dGTP pyrophosphatase MutT (NUDIX family)